MRIGDNFSFPFSLLGASGASTNADATPTGVLRRNGTTVAGASITLTSSGTGEYSAQVVFAADDGWAAGDSWTFRVSYAIGGVAQTLAWSGQMRASVAVENSAVADAVRANFDANALDVNVATSTTEDSGPQPFWDTLNALSSTVASYIQSGDPVPAKFDLAERDALAARVWAASARTLSSFGSLVSELWNAPNRALTAFGFTVATTANATEAAIKARTDLIPNAPAAVGNAMTLTPAEREASATIMEAHLLNEGDGQQIVNAIVGAIGNQNIDQLALVAAVRSDIERNGGKLAAIFADYARRNGDYATPSQVAAIKTKTDLLPASPATEGNVTSALNAANAAKASADAAARPNQVSPTIDFSPIINPPAVNVNGGFLASDRAALSEKPNLAEMNAGLNLSIGTPAIENIVAGVSAGIGSGLAADVAAGVAASLRGGGDLLFNPRVLSAQGVPVSGAAISIRYLDVQGGEGTTTFLRGLTGADGRVRFGDVAGFALEPRRYLALVRAGGFLPFAPVDFDLGEDFAPDWSLERQTAAAPSEAGEVELVLDLGDYGEPRIGATATLQLIHDTKMVTLGGRYISAPPLKVRSGADGRVVWHTPPSSAFSRSKDGDLLAFRVTCPSPYVNELLIVPDAGGNVFLLPKA